MGYTEAYKQTDAYREEVAQIATQAQDTALTESNDQDGRASLVATRSFSSPPKKPASIDPGKFSSTATNQTTTAKTTSIFTTIINKISRSFSTAARAISSAASKLFHPIDTIRAAHSQYTTNKLKAAKEAAALQKLNSWNQKYEETFYTGQTRFVQGHQCQGYYTAHETGLLLHLLKYHDQLPCNELLGAKDSLLGLKNQIHSKEGKKILLRTKMRLERLTNASTQFRKELEGYKRKNSQGQRVSHRPLTEKFGDNFRAVVESLELKLFIHFRNSYIGSGCPIPTIDKIRDQLSSAHKQVLANQERASQEFRHAQQGYRSDFEHEVDPLNRRGFGVYRM